MLDVHEVMEGMTKTRPVFHSEADFQHSLAWELHLRYPSAHIRLERVFPTSLGRLHVDFLCLLERETCVFELKYKTRAAALLLDGEEFYLQDHSAQPPTRYDFIKDIARLEAIVHNNTSAIRGFAVFLTNDSAYWCKPRAIDGVSSALSVHDGRRLSGTLDWGSTASAGTKLKREQAIRLRAEYDLEWREYSAIDVPRYPNFRYLVVPVTAT
jgi:hypothetical protein